MVSLLHSHHSCQRLPHFLLFFEQTHSKTSLRQMTIIITAMMRMNGRVTMLGLSRWTDRGGSYRTIQRFFHTELYHGRLCSGCSSKPTYMHRSTNISLQEMRVWSPRQGRRRMEWIASFHSSSASLCEVWPCWRWRSSMYRKEALRLFWLSKSSKARLRSHKPRRNRRRKRSHPKAPRNVVGPRAARTRTRASPNGRRNWNGSIK